MKKFYLSLFSLICGIVLFSNASSQVFFSYDMPGSCEPATVTLYNMTDTFPLGLQGIAVYNWDLPGGPYMGFQPPPQVLDAGFYTIALTVVDDFDWSVKGSYSEDFYVESTISDFQISTGLQACPGEQITVWVESDSWWMLDWDFGDGTFKTNQNYDNHPTHTYKDPGIYDITLSFGSNCGSDTIVKQINISTTATPTVQAYTIYSGVFCPNDPVNFDVDGQFTSYLWNFGDGNTSTKKGPVHYYDTQVDKQYNVSLTVTNMCGQNAVDNILVDFVTSAPAHSYFDWYAADGSQMPCPNTPIQFNARASGSYFWDFGDGGFSEEPNPVNLFPQVGTYTVTLEVSNGCGDVATHTEDVYIQLNQEDTPNIEFLFKINGLDWEELWSMDTLEVCPGELVAFDNQSYSWSGSPVSYAWDFGDGQSSNLKNPSHVYSGPGVYEVILSGSTACGGNSEFYRYVYVNPAITPEANLGVLPLIVCDGEEVYFFDNEGSFDRYNLIYDIDFGDGETMNGITAPTDSILMTLANHPYSGASGTFYISTFSVTNQCGNSYERVDTITITDDPDQKPFYYISNSTRTDENQQPDDWSVRHDPTDHKFKVSLNWPLWTPALNDTFYVYFFYDGFYPDGENQGNPDGYVRFESSMIASMDSVTAYVPIDPLEAPFVGIVAGWACDGIIEPQEEPEAWGMLTDGLAPINTVSLIPGGFTDLLMLGPPITLNPDWDGLCNDEKPRGKYSYEVGVNSYVVLDFWGGDQYELYGSDDPQGNNWLTTFSYGTYSLMGENMIMFNDQYSCFDMGDYNFTIGGGQLSFTSMNEYCPERAQYLEGDIFTDLPDYGESANTSACVGDPVQFTVAGGTSYKWNFGDGFTSTEKYPVHTYSVPGNYNAYVVATNSCGRTDTIHTYVAVTTDNIPNANFYTDQWDVPRYEPVHFYADDSNDEYTKFYSYEWDFGDGNTSTARSPIHIYERNGEYVVTLTVSNSCGENTSWQSFYVQDAALTCQAKFDVSVAGKVATFTDFSWGEASEWQWNFGDGFTSTAKNPTHTYTNDGIYYVCLSIFDKATNCAHQICKEVLVGTLICRADFRFTANDLTQTVKFTDASINAVDRFWDFGDGTFSEEDAPVHTYSEPGVYPVYLAIFDPGSGCFSEMIKKVSVGTSDLDFCFADFSFFVDETNRTGYFTDESSSNVSEWYWTFGDGTYWAKRHPEHIFPHDGLFNVCLIVFDETTGCVAEVCKQVPVGVDACNMRADFAHFIDIDNNAITFSNKSTGVITDWFWNFGDGATSSRKNPVHTYEKPGFYLVTLSVFNKEEDCADHIAEFVQVGSVDCRASFEYSVNPETKKVTFTNKSKGNIVEYFWFFGDGVFSVEKSPTHVYPAQGLYFAELTVIDETGLCMDWYLEPVQVGTLSCRAKFNYFIDSTANTAYFKPEAIGTVTDYLWFFGDGSVSTAPKPVHFFEQPGYFTVGLNTYNETDNCMDYYEEVILIGAEGIDCRAGFMYMANPETYEVTFTDKSKGRIVDYIWVFGDYTEPVFGEANPIHSYELSGGGYYLVCQTVVNNWFIPNTKCKFIQVAPDEAKDCFADFRFTVDSASRRVRFTDKSFGNPDGWLWKFGDGKISEDQNPVHTYDSPDFYMVHLRTMNSTTGCTSHHYAMINAGMANQGIQAGFAYDIDEDDLKADSYPVDFIGVSLGDGNKLKWDFGDGSKTDTTNLNPKHTYTAPGTYTACLTISNPVTGASDTYCDTIQVGPVSTGSLNDLGNTLQVYPNPFEDITNIVYMLINDTEVDLSVFDNAGRKIATLVREYKGSGRHEVEFSRKNLDSGVYHIRLITGDLVITKMIIIR